MATKEQIDFMAGAIAVPLGVMVAFAIGMYACFSGGFVMAKIWEWYAVPFGLPLISWKNWAAAVMLVGFFKAHKGAKAAADDHRTGAEKWAHAAGFVVAPWATLLIAWVIL